MSTPGLPPDDERFGADLGASLRHHVANDPRHPNLLSGSLHRAHRLRRRRTATALAAAALAVVLGLGGTALATFLPRDTATPDRPDIAGTATPSASPTPAPTTTSPYAVSLSAALPTGQPPDVAWVNAGAWHALTGQTVPLAQSSAYAVGWSRSGSSLIATAAGVFAPRTAKGESIGYSIGGNPVVPLAGGPDSVLKPFPYNGGVIWPRVDTNATITGYVYLDAQGRQHTWPAFSDGWQATAGTTRYLWGTRDGKVGRFNPDALTDATIVPGYTDVLGGDPVSNIVALRRADGCTALMDAQSLTVLATTCQAPGFVALSQDGRYYAGADAQQRGTIHVIDLTNGDTVATVRGAILQAGEHAVFDAGDRLVVVAQDGSDDTNALVTVDFLHRSATVSTDWISMAKSVYQVVVPNSEQGATSPRSHESTPTQPNPSSTAPSNPSSPPSAGTPSSHPSTPTTSAAVAACTAGDTTVAVKPQEGGGAAGSYAYDVTVTNTGSAPCTLHGFPGVSMVMGDEGSQLGAAADRDGTATATVTVKPDGRATATLIVTEAGNYGDACSPHQARGFRVYLPGERDAQFAKADVTGCQNSDIHLLTIRAFGS